MVLRYMEDHHLPDPGDSRPKSDTYKPSDDGSGTSVLIALHEDEIIDIKARHSHRKGWAWHTAQQISGPWAYC